MIPTRVKSILLAVTSFQTSIARAVITASFGNPFFSANNGTVKNATKITATVTGINNPTWTQNIVQRFHWSNAG